MTEHDTLFAHVAAAGAVIGAWMEYMPKVAALFAAVYYVVLISKTLYHFFNKDKKNG